MQVYLLKRVENIVAKGKLLIMNNLSFCNNVFKSFFFSADALNSSAGQKVLMNENHIGFRDAQ